MIENLPFGPSLKSFLESSDTYRRWKHSEAGLWLWRQFARKHNDILRREDQYFALLLRPMRSREFPIFDIGANVGWVSKTFLRFSERVVAVDPDRLCQEMLTNRYKRKKAFHLVTKAASDVEGTKEFLIQEEGSALNTFSDKWRKELEADFFNNPFLFTEKKVTVQTTTLDQLIAEYGLPCLAKIDVEGHELEVMTGLKQPIPLVVFEANLPVFLTETEIIVEMLQRLDETVSFNYSLNFETMLPKYVSASSLLKTLKEADKCSIDIICRMSNYAGYFHLD